MPWRPFDKLVDYRVPLELREEVLPGSIVDITFGRSKTWGLVFDLTETPSFDPEKIRELTSLRVPDPIFDRARLDFLRRLSSDYLYPIGEVCEGAIPAAIRDGSAKALKTALEKSTETSTPLIQPPHVALNEAQRAAVAAIEGTGGVSLLWGITGSGKTEVYLEAIEHALNRGEGAIVLVPEIALTPQLTQRFESRFPEQVAMFHSGLKTTQVRQAWIDVLKGRKRIALGPRSAIFAPVPKLGIIVVDEEHDGSYKQEERLRYHARDAAVILGELTKASVVLGSATPSAETFDRVLAGTCKELRLPERAVENAKLPQLEIVDLRTLLAEPSHATIISEAGEEPGLPDAPSIKGDFFLSPRLRQVLEETLALKQQSILFLNRRGLGSQDICRQCGHTPQCPNCEISLTPHVKGLLCHYCGYNDADMSECSACHAGDSPFTRVGVGTEAVERALKFHFPKARVTRLDRDSIETRDDYEKIIGGFRKHESDILVGTQMVAKGHDFPKVTLVGILLADMGLALPDFRANERCLQVLLQVSGRAGRAGHEGRVILQTFQPDHPVFEALIRQRSLDDYREFLEGEIRTRRELKYPPCGKLALFRFDGLDRASVFTAAEKVARGLGRLPNDSFRVLGPVASPLAKLRNRFRAQILVKTESQEALLKATNWILDGWDKEKLEKELATRLTVDIDPQSMM